jgi:hypothetical protein
MSAATTSRPAVSVDELKRAWTAVQAGDFRNRADRGAGRATSRPTLPPAPAGAEWIPAAGERTIAVLGAAGTVGTSTVALALGLAAPGTVRVVECCSVTASSLAAASTAELGLHPSGWRQGKRDHVLLERASEHLVHVEEVPAPIQTEAEGQLTILDVGWSPRQVLATGCWLSDATQAADALVVVAPVTVPGLRRLEAALELLGNGRAAVALVGPRRKKWPKGVEQSAGPITRRALDADRCVEIPEDRCLAVTGLDSRPMPEPVAGAASQLLDHLHLAHD